MQKNIDDLISASAALLSAEELLMRSGVSSTKARDLAAETMTLARDTIFAALVETGDPQQKSALLRSACDLDGIESPLAARAARAFAEAVDDILAA